MAQAAFFVNALRVIDKGKVLILEAQRQCGHGNIVDQVYLSFPAELKSALSELVQASESEQEATPPTESEPPVWENRLREYFNGEC